MSRGLALGFDAIWSGLLSLPRDLDADRALSIWSVEPLHRYSTKSSQTTADFMLDRGPPVEAISAIWSESRRPSMGSVAPGQPTSPLNDVFRAFEAHADSCDPVQPHESSSHFSVIPTMAAACLARKSPNFTEFRWHLRTMAGHP